MKERKGLVYKFISAHNFQISKHNSNIVQVYLDFKATRNLQIPFRVEIEILYDPCLYCYKYICSSVVNFTLFSRFSNPTPFNISSCFPQI